MKGNNYYNIQKKFQVHVTNIFFGLGAKNKYLQLATTPSIPNFHSLPYP